MKGFDIGVETDADVDGSEVDVDVDMNGSSDMARPDDAAATCPSGSCGCGREPEVDERVSQDGYKLSPILPPRLLDAPGYDWVESNVLVLIPFHSAPSHLYSSPIDSPSLPTPISIITSLR